MVILPVAKLCFGLLWYVVLVLLVAVAIQKDTGGQGKSSALRPKRMPWNSSSWVRLLPSVRHQFHVLNQIYFIDFVAVLEYPDAKSC